MAKTIMDDIINGGKVVRGWLGVAIQNLTEDLAKSFDYEGTGGVLIGDVTDGGPAQQAGLESGDIVVAFDGRRVDDMNQLRNTVAATKPGTRAKIDIVRHGRRLSKTVEVGELEARGFVATGSESTENLGFTVRALTPNLCARLGLDDDQQGVVVTNVEPGSPAERAGLQVKDVIVAVGSERVTDLGSFQHALAKQATQPGARLQVMTGGIRRFVYVDRG
jgi:serine protease Do